MMILALVAGAVAAQAGAGGSVGMSLRPLGRPAIAEDHMTAIPASLPGKEFDAWLDDFRNRAAMAGLDEDVLDRAFRGVSYEPGIVRRDENQAEFSRTLWEYLETAVSETRIRNGRAMMRRHARTLDAIEARYGVEKQIVAAIWGLESAYGSWRGSTNVIAALATLAFDGRRADFFENELIAALTILQKGETTPENLRGSWAGAMGHTQFMPTSYLLYAEDFDGDGRRDIWSDDPADALASTAGYLARFGWTYGQPWGVEVTLPAGFDYLQADRRITRLPSEWARLGVLGLDGRPVPDHGPASILLPGGYRGPAFMIFPNFAVLERYNPADAYVIAVGHLGDRLMGGGPFRQGWPRDVRALGHGERAELQARLTELGFDTQGIDGRIGPLTIDALRRWQKARGLVPDGFATPALLQALREERG